MLQREAPENTEDPQVEILQDPPIQMDMFAKRTCASEKSSRKQQQAPGPDLVVSLIQMGNCAKRKCASNQDSRKHKRSTGRDFASPPIQMDMLVKRKCVSRKHLKAPGPDLAVP